MSHFTIEMKKWKSEKVHTLRIYIATYQDDRTPAVNLRTNILRYQDVHTTQETNDGNVRKYLWNVSSNSFNESLLTKYRNRYRAKSQNRQIWLCDIPPFPFMFSDACHPTLNIYIDLNNRCYFIETEGGGQDTSIKQETKQMHQTKKWRKQYQ